MVGSNQNNKGNKKIIHCQHPIIAVPLNMQGFYLNPELYKHVHVAACPRLHSSPFFCGINKRGGGGGGGGGAWEILSCEVPVSYLVLLKQISEQSELTIPMCYRSLLFCVSDHCEGLTRAVCEFNFETVD